jgi:hypothetical protein
MLSTTLYTKTIQHLTLKQRNDTSRLIELSTYHQIKLFFTHDLQKNGGIDIQQIRSSNNLADFFTKVIPTTNFEKLVQNIRVRRLKDLN